MNKYPHKFAADFILFLLLNNIHAILLGSNRPIMMQKCKKEFLQKFTFLGNISRSTFLIVIFKFTVYQTIYCVALLHYPDETDINFLANP